MIYLDHNATTPLDERVLDAMLPYLKTFYGNPSALYRHGRIAQSAIDQAREHVAALVDAEPNQVIFTSGGTEANCLAIRQAQGQCIAASTVEHPSVINNLPDLAIQLPVTENGVIDLTSIRDQVWQSGDWLAVMLANNETGAIQPLAELSEFLVGRNVWLHCDAVQALGKMPVSFRQLAVQSMSLSSHKIYGPKGCGALVLADPAQAKPLFAGGDQEQALRAGTENVAAIVGFGCAAVLARQELQQRIQHMWQLRHSLEQALRSLKGLVIFSEHVERLPNTVQFAVPNHSGEMMVMQLDGLGIAVSSGSACASGSEHISPVLAAMKVDPMLAKAAVRISLGASNQQAHIDQLIAALKTICG